MADNCIRVVADKNIPFLEPLGKVCSLLRLPDNEITAEVVRTADALLVRTRNRCDEALLEGSKVKLIGSATIGTDHIDAQWCERNGIKVVNAPGCNAPAVAQYVFSSLMKVINRPLSSYRIGIVGVGNVGSIVAKWGQGLNMKTLLCDPFKGYPNSIEEICAKADIITFHTPLTHSGPYPTYHLADCRFFESLRRSPIIINSARGAVVDTAAWADALDAGVCGDAIVDCWEGEPDIDRRLLKAAAIATPHIAGYSVEGKMRASAMVVESLCRYFSLPKVELFDKSPAACADTISAAVALASFKPESLSDMLKESPEQFEYLRNSYTLRHEPQNSFEK